MGYSNHTPPPTGPGFMDFMIADHAANEAAAATVAGNLRNEYNEQKARVELISQRVLQQQGFSPESFQRFELPLQKDEISVFFKNKTSSQEETQEISARVSSPDVEQLERFRAIKLAYDRSQSGSSCSIL